MKKKKYGGQLSQILDYINKLNQVNTENIEPTFNTTGLKNSFRNDNASISLPQEKTLKNASQPKNGLFITEGIFKEE